MVKVTKQSDQVVTLSKKEYVRLKNEARAYRAMAAKVFELPLCDPVGDVVADFLSTELYTKEFLTDLEDGLRKSSYAKKYVHQTAAGRR